MSRVFNFSPGPAMLPEPVMRQIKEELIDWHGIGISIMELSHRCSEFIGVAEAAEQSLRDLLNIPYNYHILFMHGGGQGQFSAIPMNLMDDYSHAAYVQTGVWGKIAIDEAKRLCKKVTVIANSEDKNHTYIPDQKTWSNCSDAAYLHYVDNETVNGVEFVEPPKNMSIPLIVDMSSNLLSRPIKIEDYGLIYACAQKNLGPSGITVVIVKDELLSRKPYDRIPRIFDYRRQAEKQSMVNTPSTFPWYVIGLVTEWVKAEGGLAEMDRRAKQRSKLLYDFIDQSDFYSNPVDPAVRSRMNVIFFLKDESLNERFLQQAVEVGLSGLKGHRLLGGMRASMYIAMSQAGADALVDFMKDFEKQYG